MRIRNLLSGMHLALILLIAFSIAVFSYLILRVHHARFDLSKGKVYSLSTQSVRLLKAMEDTPIQVSAFFRDGFYAKRDYETLLKEFSYQHKNFNYQFLDPDRMPAKVKQYKIEAYETVVIEVGERQEQTRQLTEEAMTNLLARLYRNETKTIVFAQGHSGALLNDVESQGGYGVLKEKLEQANYVVKEVTLLRDSISPDAHQLVVLGGPKVDVLDEELKIIEKYLADGGHVLILMDPVEAGEGNNLKEFLLNYGVVLGEDVIVDKLSKLFGADYLIPLVTEYHLHAITKGFQLASFFPIARTVRKAEEVSETLEVTQLAWTGSGSWAESDLPTLQEGSAEFDKETDEAGPLPIAVSVSHATESWRLVVVGDSEFAGNAYLNLSGNKDLILNICAWLTGDDFAISIRPRSRETTPLFLKEADQSFLFFVPVLGLPIFFVGTGSGVFLWRRRFH